MGDQISTLTAALKGSYEIVREAGAGGMATVYLADDLKHHRPVAIKVLRPELAASVGSDRFLREIELAAGLQHPHILAVYDSGAAGDLLYYVMPFVDGESLRERLDRDGALPVDEAARLVREVAGALDYANSHGVVHRDIKPENILLFGGHAVVADFGVARAVESSGGPGLTGMGLAIGTPAYMSPEQATATTEIDGRSDQYSLAAVAFEMLTGQRAFDGATVQAVLTKSISGPRPRVREVRPALPASTDTAIVRALAQDPEARFPSSTAFAEALDAHGSGAYDAAVRGSRRWLALAALVVIALGTALVWALSRAPRQIVEGAERIAVMPFRTTGAGVELLGEGLVDLLSTNLDGVGGVRTVEPRSVLSRVRDHDGPLDLESSLNIARALDATGVLMGSVIETGRSVRLAADLYAADGRKLGHAQVDGAADSMLSLVDALSLALVREIWRSNDPIPSIRVAGVTTTSLAAMREYLRAEQFYRASQWDSAAAGYANAVAADSTFALAYLRLAMTYGWTGNANSPSAAAAGQAAVRFAGRLPANERALVQAYRLFQVGDVSSIDSMLKYTTANPRDPDGWYLLGESRFHAREIRPASPEQLREPFDRVLALDSSLTPAAIHPLELALASRDQVWYDRYLRVLERAGATTELSRFRPAKRVVFETDPDDSTIAELSRNARGDVMMATAAGLLNRAETERGVTVLQRLVDQAEGGDREPALQAQTFILAGLGRLDRAREVSQQMAPQNEARTFAPLIPVFGGFAPPGYADSLAAVLDRAVREAPQPDSVGARFQNYFRAIFLLSTGRLDSARRFIDMGSRSTAGPPFLQYLFTSLDGWYDLAKGDTLQGLTKIRRSVDSAGAGVGTVLTAPVRLRRAMAMAAIPRLRDEAITELRYGFATDPMFEPIATLEAARALAAAGRRDEAADFYSRFLKAWRGADPQFQPIVTQARRELVELQRAGG